MVEMRASGLCWAHVSTLLVLTMHARADPPGSNAVTLGNARFTVVSPSLIRLELSTTEVNAQPPLF